MRVGSASFRGGRLRRAGTRNSNLEARLRIVWSRPGVEFERNLPRFAFLFDATHERRDRLRRVTTDLATQLYPPLLSGRVRVCVGNVASVTVRHRATNIVSCEKSLD